MSELTDKILVSDIPASIFGSGSWVDQTLSAASPTAEMGMVNEFWFQLLVALLALIFLAWLNYWGARRAYHVSPFRFVGKYSSSYPEKFGAIPPSYPMYMRMAQVLGFWALSLIAIRQTDVAIAMGDRGYHMIVIALALVPLVFWLYQWIVISVIGLLSYDHQFVNQLFTIKRIVFAIFVISTVPPILLYLLTDYRFSEYMAYVIVIESIAIIVLYLLESFFLFLSKKVSILHWFLYLCGVELLPIATIWALISRI